MTNLCDGCAKKDVCKYSDKYKEIIENFAENIPDDLPFKFILNCDKYVSDIRVKEIEIPSYPVYPSTPAVPNWWNPVIYTSDTANWGKDGNDIKEHPVKWDRDHKTGVCPLNEISFNTTKENK